MSNPRDDCMPNGIAPVFVLFSPAICQVSSPQIGLTHICSFLDGLCEYLNTVQLRVERVYKFKSGSGVTIRLAVSL